MLYNILWMSGRQQSKHFPLSATDTPEIIENGAWVHLSHLH